MSEPFFINDFKQNPDCYLDKEPAIVKELPEENRIVYNYYFEDDMVWCLTMDKIFYSMYISEVVNNFGVEDDPCSKEVYQLLYKALDR